MPFDKAVAVDENFNLPGPVINRIRETLAIPRVATQIIPSGALSPGQRALGTINIGSEFQLISVQLSHKGRLRLYAEASKREADLARAAGTDPKDNHGVILDVQMTTTDILRLSPQVLGATALPDEEIYYTIDNLDSGPAVLVATLVSRRMD